MGIQDLGVSLVEVREYRAQHWGPGTLGSGAADIRDQGLGDPLLRDQVGGQGLGKGTWGTWGTWTWALGGLWEGTLG